MSDLALEEKSVDHKLPGLWAQ